MSSISPELLNRIKAANNILDVVGEFVVLKKSGANFSGLCPFHAERSPSFSVSERKQLYHCYGCKKGGDLVSFVMEMMGLSFPQAVLELADRSKVSLPKDALDSLRREPGLSPEEGAERAKDVDTLFRLNRFAAAFFHQKYLNNKEAREYALKRGVSAETEKLFYLGYASPNWDDLSHHLMKAKAPLEKADELGLVRKNAQGKYFDLFRSRFLFPILDLRGRVVAFGGRFLPSPGEGEKDQPKYLNSPESKLFHKSKALFGLYHSQKYIREADEVLIVEGYFDALALWEAGFKNVVATCGTSLTLDHLKLLKRICNKITIVFDADEAGVQATERAMELGLENGLVLYSVKFSGVKDPDELVFKEGKKDPAGVETLKLAIADAQPILDSLIEAWTRKAAEGPEQKTQAVKQIRKWLGIFKDPIGVKIRAGDVARSLGVAESLLGVASPLPMAMAPKRPVVIQRPIVKSNQPLGPVDHVFLSKVALSLENLEGIRHDFDALSAELPPDPEFRAIFEDPELEQWWQQVKSYPLGALDPAEAISWLQTKAFQSQLTEVLMGEGGLQLTETDGGGLEVEKFKEAKNRLLTRRWARFSQKIKSRLTASEAGNNGPLSAQLMQEYLDVQRKMKELNNLYDQG